MNLLMTSILPTNIIIKNFLDLPLESSILHAQFLQRFRRFIFIEEFFIHLKFRYETDSVIIKPSVLNLAAICVAYSSFRTG